MKRKRRWWIGLIIAFACIMIVLAVAELTGTSIAGILGWGALGIAGVVGFVLALGLLAVFLVLPITGIIWWLVKGLTSNKEVVYITLGSLGLCAIVAGWVLAIQQSQWSLPVMLVGFGLGCFAGLEYQKDALSRSNESTRRLEQVSDEENRRDG